MRAIDLCAGAGGLSLGLQRAGWDVLGVEIDPVAVATHRANVGPCEQASIVDWSPAGPSPIAAAVSIMPRSLHADLVCGGVPCQPFSEQGKRGGTDDPRGRLFEHLARIAREAGARACMLENVKGIAHSRNGAPPALADVAAAFVRAGFVHLRARVLDAADFGTPQHRKRLILIGFRDAADDARFEWPEPSHGPGRAPFGTVRAALRLGPGRFATGARKVTDGADRRGRGWFQGGRCINVDRPSYTIGTRNNADLIVPALEDGSPDWAAAWRPTDPRQVAALQGWPAGFTWPAKSDDAHRVIGNAVPPQLGEALGRAIRNALRPGSVTVLRRS